jgi:protein-L-isoaspartate O-methyltransferase
MPLKFVALAVGLTVLQAVRTPFVATPPDVVDRMLTLAQVDARDVVYDLGCGDGRIVIAAARTYGARGVGVDIDPARIEEARMNAQRAGVEHLVTFRTEDARTTDISEATVVTLYLVAALNAQLRPRLAAQLRPGARIVSHNFPIGTWEPDRVDVFRSADGQTRTLLLWSIPGI